MRSAPTQTKAEKSVLRRLLQLCAQRSAPRAGCSCDEAVFPHGEDIRGKWRFHFSTVLWLGSAGIDFEGGALAFYSNASKPWLQVEPRLGRAALFSSGWENVHGIRPVVRGERWALTAAFMVHDKLLPPQHAGRDFYDQCVHPVSKGSYAQCRQHWAARMMG